MALAGALLFAAALVGVLQLADLLRHPHPADRPLLDPAEEADPRFEPDCPEPQPVEGQARAAPSAGPAAEPVAATSDDLFDCPESWSGRSVRYRGEVVGGVLRRDGHAWVHLNDDVYAGDIGPLPAHRDYRGGNAGVGVLLPADLAAEIGVVGGPRERGDVLEVVGTFHRVDPEHREVAVIVAEAGRVVAPGETIDRPLLGDRLVAAVVLALLAAGAVVAERVAAGRRW